MAISLMQLEQLLLLGLLAVTCNAAPIHNLETDLPETDMPQVITGPAVFYLSVGFVLICGIVIFGCTCCLHKDIQGMSNPNHNPALQFGENNIAALQNSSEFTIFPPCSSVINLQPVYSSSFGNEMEKVIFEPLPDILPKRHINGQSLAQSSKPAHFSALLKMKSSLNDWFDDPSSNFPRSNLQYLQEVGTGWFGCVVEGEAQMIIDGQEKTPVIVKILREEASPSEHLYFLHDVQPYRDLQHPNIVRLLGRCLESDPFLLIMEHTNVNLKTYLMCNRDRLINEEGSSDKLMQITCDIISGLSHMHEHNFTHNDLAAHNCFVGMNNIVKIGDYGLSLDTFKEDYFCVGEMALPIRWLAPESLSCTATSIETRELSKEANIWSLGIVLWEVMELGELPYLELTDQEVLQKVIVERKAHPQSPRLFHPYKTEMYQIMQLCWQAESCRPKASVVLMLLTQLKTNKKLPDSYSSFEQRWDALSSKTHSSSCSLQQKFENDFVLQDQAQSSVFLQESSTGSFNCDSSSCELFNGIIDACRSPSLKALNGSFDELLSEDCDIPSVPQMPLDHQAIVRESSVDETKASTEMEAITCEQITEAIRDLDAMLAASESVVLDVDSHCIATEPVLSNENQMKVSVHELPLCKKLENGEKEVKLDGPMSYTSKISNGNCYKDNFYKNGMSLFLLPEEKAMLVDNNFPSSSLHSLPSISDPNFSVDKQFPHNSLPKNSKIALTLPDILITESSASDATNHVQDLEEDVEDQHNNNHTHSSDPEISENTSEHCITSFTNTVIQSTGNSALNALEAKPHSDVELSVAPLNDELSTKDVENENSHDSSFSTQGNLFYESATKNKSAGIMFGNSEENYVFLNCKDRFFKSCDDATRDLTATNPSCFEYSLNENREFKNNRSHALSDFVMQVSDTGSSNNHAYSGEGCKSEKQEFLCNGIGIAADEDDSNFLGRTHPDICKSIESAKKPLSLEELQNLHDVCDSFDSLNAMHEDLACADDMHCSGSEFSQSNCKLSQKLLDDAMQSGLLDKEMSSGNSKMFSLGVRGFYDEETENWTPEHQLNNNTMNSRRTLAPLPEDELLCTSNDREIESSGLELKMNSSEDYDDEDHLEQDEVLKIDIETNEAILVDTSESLIGFVPSRSIELLQECDCVISNFEAAASAEKSFETESGLSEEEVEDVNANHCNGVSNEDLTTDPISSYGENFISSDDGLESEYDRTDDNEVVSSPKGGENNFQPQNISIEDSPIARDSNDNQNTGSKHELNNNNSDSSDLYNDILFSVQPTKSVIWHSDETLDVLEDDNKKGNSIILEGKEILAGIPYQENLICDSPTSDTKESPQYGSWSNFLNLGISGYPSPSCSASSTPSHDILYTPDFESESEESSSSCSSTSGSFECIHNKFKNVGDIASESAKKESSPVTETDNKEQSPLKIFSKTWDCHATPNKGLLKSPEKKKLAPIRKSVSFHEDPQLVFQYPPASDSSEEECIDDDNYMRHVDYTSYADWELHASEDDEIPEEMIEIEELESEPYNRSLRFRGSPSYPFSGTSLYTITGFSEEEDLELNDGATFPTSVQSPPDEKSYMEKVKDLNESESKTQELAEVLSGVRSNPSSLVQIEEVSREDDVDTEDGCSAADQVQTESFDMEIEENDGDYKDGIGAETSYVPQLDSAEPLANSDPVELADASSSSLDLMDVSDSSDCNQSTNEVIEARKSGFGYFGIDPCMVNGIFNEDDEDSDENMDELSEEHGSVKNSYEGDSVTSIDMKLAAGESKHSENFKMCSSDVSDGLKNCTSLTQNDTVNNHTNGENLVEDKNVSQLESLVADQREIKRPKELISRIESETFESCEEEFLRYVNLPLNEHSTLPQNANYSVLENKVKHDDAPTPLISIPAIIVTDADDDNWNNDGMKEFLEEHLKFYNTEDSDSNDMFSVTPDYSENPFEQGFGFVPSKVFDNNDSSSRFGNHQTDSIGTVPKCENNGTVTGAASTDQSHLDH